MTIRLAPRVPPARRASSLGGGTAAARSRRGRRTAPTCSARGLGRTRGRSATPSQRYRPTPGRREKNGMQQISNWFSPTCFVHSCSKRPASRNGALMMKFARSRQTGSEWVENCSAAGITGTTVTGPPAFEAGRRVDREVRIPWFQRAARKPALCFAWWWRDFNPQPKNCERSQL